MALRKPILFYVSLVLIFKYSIIKFGKIINCLKEGISQIPVNTWWGGNSYSFSMHINVPVGSRPVSGWAVIIKFDTYIKERFR